MSTEQSVRLLNLDPSFTVTGWSVSDYKLNSGKFSVYRFGVVKPAAQAESVVYQDDVEKYGKRTISLALLREHLRALVTKYNPDYIVVKDAVFDPKRPNAYGSAMFWICQATILCHNEFNMPLYTTPGRSVKLCLTGTGTSNQTVRNAVNSNLSIVFKQKKQAESASDFEYNSVAVGYYFTKEVLPNILSGK